MVNVLWVNVVWIQLVRKFVFTMLIVWLVNFVKKMMQVKVLQGQMEFV